jgi:hypothetical protein
MNNRGMLRRGALVVGTVFSLQFALPVQAGMVGTGELIAPEQVEADRAKVHAFIEQGRVVDKLKLLGVDAVSAQQRVDAMTPQEVHLLAQNIDTLPAGGVLTTSDYIIILLAIILVAIII